jgi:tRNA1Val (adenine37-N6)-methyltransferase
VLIKFVRAAKPELKILDPLYVHKEDGSYDDEIIRTYSIKELGEDLG